MATDRARRELGFTPQVDARAALRELLAGLARGSGADTPPLTPDPDTSRVREFGDRQGGREMRP
jgi:UDP-glucose 4-epimerase